MPFKKQLILSAFCAFSLFGIAQNALYIPPQLSGTTFNLVVQSGTQQFFSGNPTPTYGINGPLLSPTIVVNKGDVVTLNVQNTLSVATTMHWHGLHVAPEHDGGPHQSIAAGTTWSPSFEIKNNAGTFWYHPHGEGKTELHVGKGLAGLFIIHDPAEQALDLPETYGVDDLPIIVQTKAFDVLNQVAIADHMDTSVFVNGTLNALGELPAQVVRLRLLNGSSMRSFYFGFSNNQNFHQIATDGGLLATPNMTNRLLLAPGERSEILVDLGGMNGQTITLMSYASEMEDGIFGAPMVGTPPDEIHMYEDNFLNGADFNLVAFDIVAPTPSPVTTIPTTLVPYVPYNTADVSANRTLVFDTISLIPGETPNRAEGPFGINNEVFDMMMVNLEVPLNATEIWTLKNNTLIAHPFHIHDVQFNIIEKSGTTPPASEQGWKDVVLVMPGDSVKFITKFEDFADEMTPYMYHCHLLHHEDDGMMGSFLVIDSTAGLNTLANGNIQISPNPATDFWKVTSTEKETVDLTLFSTAGDVLFEQTVNLSGNEIKIPCESLSAGIYLLRVSGSDGVSINKLEKH